MRVLIVNKIFPTFLTREAGELLIEQAAAAKGQTVSDFAVSTLVRSAEEVLERLERRKLSDRDRDRFLELLDRSDAPTPALKKAARAYRRSAAR